MHWLGNATWVRIKALLKQSCRTYQEMEQMKNLTLLCRLLVVLWQSMHIIRLSHLITYSRHLCDLPAFAFHCNDELSLKVYAPVLFRSLESKISTCGVQSCKILLQGLSLTCTDLPLLSQCTSKF